MLYQEKWVLQFLLSFLNVTLFVRQSHLIIMVAKLLLVIRMVQLNYGISKLPPNQSGNGFIAAEIFPISKVVQRFVPAYPRHKAAWCFRVSRGTELGC